MSAEETQRPGGCAGASQGGRRRPDDRDYLDRRSASEPLQPTTMPSNSSRSASGSNGLATNSSQPAARASFSPTIPEMATTATYLVPSAFFSLRIASNPAMTGDRRSMTITSGANTAATKMASSRFGTASTNQPAARMHHA